MELFKTTGVLDKAVLKEIAKNGIPKREKWAVIVVYFGGSIILSAVRHPALADFFIFCGVLGVLYQHVLFKRITINKNLCNMQECNGVSEYQYTIWFDEDGVVVSNLTNHGDGKFKYIIIKRLFETEHIFALQTKNKQFVPIFKSGLSPEEIGEMIAFLKTQNRKIKIDRLKKRNNKGTQGI